MMQCILFATVTLCPCKWQKSHLIGDDTPLVGGREPLPLMNFPFCLPFPLKGEGEVLGAPVALAGDHVLLIGTELEDSDTSDDIPERFALVVALPLPEPLPLGFCDNKEAIVVCG